jgi:ComF family protein
MPRSLISKFIDELLPNMEPVGDAACEEEAWEADEPGTYCRRCGASAAAEAQTLSGCPHCRGKKALGWDGVWRLGAYKQPLSRWIIGMKFRRAWGWAEWFGKRLAGQVVSKGNGGGNEVVVPVPLHWSRRMGRGYDQAGLVAEAFAKARGLPVARLLRRTRKTGPQSDLHNHAARLRNVRRAFAIERVDLRGVTVWLIDDVKTSGATAKACAKLLRAAGAERVNLAVIAVADPHGSDFERS